MRIAFVDGIKAALAKVTDALAVVGERAPTLSQVTVSAAGVTVTVTPKPPPAPPASVCPHCGRT